MAGKKYRIEGGGEIDAAAIEKMAEAWERGQIPGTGWGEDCTPGRKTTAGGAVAPQEPPAGGRAGEETAEK